MQTTQFIQDKQLNELINIIYSDGAPVVKEAYSEFDAPTVTFRSASELRANIEFIPKERAFFYYAIYYPDAKGFVLEKRIKLKPRACKGHTHRFSQEGWGLIFLHITFQSQSRIECCVAVNSNARAETWSNIYPELKSPDLWDWTIVSRYAGRLTRLLRKLGKQSDLFGTDAGDSK
jgi:hypothetical protein